MLTKEKCLDALSALEMEIMHASSLSYKYKERVLSVSNVLFQLINEHFNNPPLEFLDIEEGDWIWNNASKEYIKVLNKYVHQGKGMLVIKNHLRNHPEEIKFVEGRFYRKQVQENEME